MTDYYLLTVKTIIRYVFVFLMFSISCLSMHAQSSRLYDAEQLSSNQITSLCQDGQGYIWIGTEYGLNKFDGVHFRQYFNDEENANSLFDNIIRHLFTDKDGNVWVVSNRSVQRYNYITDSFETVNFGERNTSDVNDILQTADGHIWLLSAVGGVFQVDMNSLSAQLLDDINKVLKKGSKYDNMFLDSKQRLWVSFESRGLQMIDTRTKQTYFYDETKLQGRRAVDMTETDGKHFVIATYTDLLQYNDATNQFENIVTFPRMAVHRLYKGKKGQLLIGTSGSGLWSVDTAERTCVQVNEVTIEKLLTLGHEKVFAYLYDRGGNNWIGCHQHGLLFTDAKPSPFHFLPLSQMQNNNGNVLRSVHADANRHVYICQEKGGITSINHSGQTLGHWLQDYTVMTMLEDGQTAFWVGTYRNGLFRLDTQTGHEEHIASTKDQRIGSITRDLHGNIYTAVFNDGLHSYTPDGKTERTLGKGKLQLTNPYLNTIFTDRAGLIWIGHYYGIDIYDPKSDRLLNIDVDPALRPAIVYAIGQSPNDQSILIGTNKGLFQYFTQGQDKGQWKRFTIKQGLPNDIINSLVITADGTIWVSTYRGMGRIDSQGQFTRYYRGNGLEEWSYLRGVGCFSTWGEVIFGNQNGITYFIPGKITRDEFSRGITLTGMRMGDIDVNASTLSNGKLILTKPLEESTDISVSYLDNTFSLRFSSMDFRDSQNVHYEFRFAGESGDQWYQTESGRSEIFFSHLAIGSHLLQVRAYDNGVYSPIKEIRLIVSPPWYRTWVAYVLYLLAILGIITLWWRNYWNRRQADINEEKIKFFVDISHELRSPLTLIKSPLEKLLHTVQDPSQTRALRNIERNTNRLLTLTNQILSIRKIEKGQMTLHFAETALGEFVGDICHDYDYQLEKRKIVMTFDNKAPDMKVWIDRDHFDKVVTNLLSNAVKYVEEGGKIDVIVRHSADSKAELVVRDNGQGIDEAQLRKVFDRFYQASARPAVGQMSYGIGLNLTQKIVTLHHGTITAHNRTDEQGSEFLVRLPLGTRHLTNEQLVDNDYYASSFEQEKHTVLITDTDKPRRVRKKTTYHVAVVDDDEEIRDFLYTELSETYHVHTYPDGYKALEGIVDMVPDLVISDVVMPQMDGFELLKRLKSSTKTSHIPVILLTTKTEHQSRVEGLEQGADAYVDKPFNLEELEVRISSLIANRLRMKGKFTGMQEQEDTLRKVELKGNDAQLMEKIMKAINSRLDDSDFNVEALADEVGLSRVQLHRRMKELTGITVGEFIRNLRLQQAAKLLEAGDTTIAQVTYAVGFANPTHFASAFKKHFGVTPSEYMAKASGKQM